ncbi:MAG: DUF1743 domain-containing protein [Candidatus Heimdallarchaeota archaeon]
MICCAFDDTDSLEGGCTTYVAAKLVATLLEVGAEFVDYPNLIRLNPNIPFKTRGNGAVCLRLKSQSITEEKVLELAQYTIDDYYEKPFKNTNPGLVVYSQSIANDIRTFSRSALTAVCTIKTAKQLAEKHDMHYFLWGNGRGLIGALAALGNPLERDHTYELLAFRSNEYWATPRRVDVNSVFSMNRKTHPLTFNNVDEEAQKSLITPHGPDPVLYGIRGENPQIVYNAHNQILVNEPIACWVIFRTNQGTDAHFTHEQQIADLKPHIPVILRGKVATPPRTIPGGHVFFDLEDLSGTIPCAAYEPSGKLRNVVRALLVRDKVRVYGGTRPPTIHNPMTLNLEKLTILELVPHVDYLNPVCLECGKRMKSAGKGKGYKCNCGRKLRNTTKICQTKARNIVEGTYYPPPRSVRHLSKPPQRIGREKIHKPEKLVEPWHGPCEI